MLTNPDTDAGDHYDFSFDGLDSIDARARELVASGKSLEPLLLEAAEEILSSGDPRLVDRLLPRVYRAACQEVSTRFLSVAMTARAPRFTLHAIAHEIGASILGNQTVPESARQFGKRKQALFQEMVRVRKLLGVESLRSNKRVKQARDLMRVTNYRHGQRKEEQG